MPRHALLLLIGIAAIIAVGCSDDDIPTTTTTKPATFPNETGYLWTYEYTETGITGNDTVVTVDTVEVVVVRDVVLPNGNSAKKWAYRYQNRQTVDTLFVESAGDTIKMYWQVQGYLMTFLFPIDTGRVWTSGGGSPDTTSVSGPFVVQVKGGNFLETYWFRRYLQGFEGHEECNLWLAPGVGMVSTSVHVVDLMSPQPDVYRSWELMEYDLTKLN